MMESELKHRPIADEFEPSIGIEIHVQLKTKSKIFCSCPNNFGDEPNTNICPICTGQPGVLPMLNKKVVEHAIALGIATKSTIAGRSSFARKHYMYPDLPKNYQITQGDLPICSNGVIVIDNEHGQEQPIRVMRIHMEEDAGKNTHTDEGYSLVDLNRAGTPLLEIVSYPDMHSSAQARAYLTQLHAIIQYIGISDANMEKGSFRADINISVKRVTDQQLGTKVELKNINSFKFIVQAIEYEIARHIDILKAGGSIEQETRLWDNKNNVSIFMRSKKDAQDYRYCPEPDLADVAIDQAWIDSVQRQMPELPCVRCRRLIEQYGIHVDDARIIVEEKRWADFFEEACRLSGNYRSIGNWMLRNLFGYMKEHRLDIDQVLYKPRHIADIVNALDSGVINTSSAQELFAIIAQHPSDGVSDLIERFDLGQIDDDQQLQEAIDDVIAQNHEQVIKYQQGNEKLFMFFVGLVMKKLKGKANPVKLQHLLKQRLLTYL